MPPPKPKPIVPTGLASSLRLEAEKHVRQRLGVPASQPLPQDVQNLITKTIASEGGDAIDTAINREVLTAIRKVYRPAQLEGFKDKIGGARLGIDTIAQSQDVDAILQRRAELLFKKRQALVTAGFSTAEAMEIVLADLSLQH